jgi:hypothetical protein
MVGEIIPERRAASPGIASKRKGNRVNVVSFVAEHSEGGVQPAVKTGMVHIRRYCSGRIERLGATE